MSATLVEGNKVRFKRGFVSGPSPLQGPDKQPLDTVRAGDTGRIASRTEATLWIILDRPTGEKGQPMVRVEAPFSEVEPI